MRATMHRIAFHLCTYLCKWEYYLKVSTATPDPLCLWNTVWLLAPYRSCSILSSSVSSRWLPCSPLPVPSQTRPLLLILVFRGSCPRFRSSSTLFLTCSFVSSSFVDFPPRSSAEIVDFVFSWAQACVYHRVISYDFEGCVEGEGVEEETFEPSLFHVSCLK